MEKVLVNISSALLVVAVGLILVLIFASWVFLISCLAGYC